MQVSAKMQESMKLLALLFVVSMLVVDPAHTETGDRDGDGIVDTVDQDDDNDGIADRLELGIDGRDIDSDGDGQPNRIDLDSDNDGIPDLYESGFFIALSVGNVRVVNGRLLEDVGQNGLVDFIETSPDSSFISFTLLNTDESDGDEVPDYLDLDSDNDGLLDLVEAGVSADLDSNRDGRIDADAGSVGNDGILDLLQINNDQNCCDFDFDGIQDVIPRNTDGGDLPDFQDLDSDNDGLNDIVEAGGQDADLDGRVDAFFDDANNPDGVDDELLLIPLPIRDSNNDGLPDHLDPGVVFVATPAPVDEGSGDDGELLVEPERPDLDADLVDGDISDRGEDPLGDGVAADTPGVAPVGFIETGLSGGGCSISRAGHGQRGDSGLLVVLFLVIAAGTLRRLMQGRPGQGFLA